MIYARLTAVHTDRSGTTVVTRSSARLAPPHRKFGLPTPAHRQAMDATNAVAATAAACAAAYCMTQQSAAPRTRRSIELSTGAATLKVDLSGGSLASFALTAPPSGSAVNPLSWDCASHDGLDVEDVKPRPLGHFLCCDRWGPPTPAELENGMYYHGEAPQVEWKVSASSASSATMGCDMPMAGMTIERSVEMAPDAAVAVVKETVTNVAKLSRMFNQVQHPSIAAPFLSRATVVDCNGKRGFAQADNTNTCAEHPELPSFEFPATINRAGTPADARTMTGGDDDVQSYEVDPAS